MSQKFTKGLLWTKYCFRCWGPSLETKQAPCRKDSSGQSQRVRIGLLGSCCLKKVRALELKILERGVRGHKICGQDFTLWSLWASEEESEF